MFKRLFNRTPRASRKDIERYVRLEYKPEEFDAAVEQLSRDWNAR